jgi:hypothetical protein
VAMTIRCVFTRFNELLLVRKELFGQCYRCVKR